MNRPIRIANCSGSKTDSGEHMYNQAKYGQVDVITGDYISEASRANSKLFERPGWEVTALDGIARTLDLIDEKKIKIIINGVDLTPRAWRIRCINCDENRNLKVAYVSGDDIMYKVNQFLGPNSPSPFVHADDMSPEVQSGKKMLSFLEDPENMPIVAANAYLGYRAIHKGLEMGADIIICGRVADASPIIAAAAWWHGWDETNYNQLAAALIAGHLIECSTYVTRTNFSGAYKYPVDQLLDLGLPIAEISSSGETVVTKHEDLGGFVTTDTVKSQLLYELQGNIYLNSDVKADIANVEVVEESKNRVGITGIQGYPPPPTMKLAIFHRSGYRNEILVNACGYNISHKWDLLEAQVNGKLRDWGVLDRLDTLEFQRVGTPMSNPDSQLAATTYMRIVSQAKSIEDVKKVFEAWNFIFMAHFAGMHCSFDYRTVIPRPFLGYYPALISQSEVRETITLIAASGHETSTDLGPPKVTEPVAPRQTYDTGSAVPLYSFGLTMMRPLGDMVLARSGDKAGNINLGLFVQTSEEWEWLRCFMSIDRLKELMGRDWKETYRIERIELAKIYAVHFVVYGILGRGANGSPVLDCLGKGFAEYIRAVHVPLPCVFMH